ncbi:MAG TPA: histidine kinase dimerization/phosphoacceptor domain -containing protein [Candidatus Limnocylindria bacterium]
MNRLREGRTGRSQDSLRPLRILQVAGIVVPVLLLSFWGMYSWRVEQARAVEQAQKSIGVVREYVLRVIQTQDLILGHVDDMIRGMSWAEIAASEEIHRQLQALHRRSDLNYSILVIDADGVIRNSSVTFPMAINVSDRAYFQELRERPVSLYMTERLTGRISANDTFAILRRRSGNTFDGIVAASVNAEMLARFFESVREDRRTVVELIRSDGNLLASSPFHAPITFLPDSNVMHAFAAAPAGLLTTRSASDGVERIYAYSRVDDLPLYVTYGIATASVMERWLNGMQIGAAFLLIMALLWFATVTQAVRRGQAARQHRRTLERQVSARTADLEKVIADKDVLLREVHHRVKNNLQMIQAMIRMHAGKVPAEAQPVFADITRRIVAIGQVYSQIYGSAKLEGLDLAVYLRTVCQQTAVGILPDDQVRLDMNLDSIEVDIDTALPIGLIAVELVMNAYKHAFPDGRRGEVAVKLQRRDRYGVLTVRDDGIGLPATRPQGITGLTLIDALAGQVDGRLKFSSLPTGGTRCRLTFLLKRSKKTAPAAKAV